MNEKCVKCGFEGADYKYEKHENTYLQPGLYLSCRRCGYEWKVTCLDEKERREKEGRGG